MNKLLRLSKVMLSVMSLTLSTGIFACSTLNTYVVDPVTDLSTTTWNAVTTPMKGWDDGWRMGAMHEPEYQVTDRHHHTVQWLDGLDHGRVVSDEGSMKKDYSYLYGDEITNVHTQKSGVIKGVKHQGTMEVMTTDGHMLRYQYVTFKVKPL